MEHYQAKRRRNSGQVLIVTSLVVLLLLISTVTYITEIEKNAPIFSSDPNMNPSTLRQAALHTVASALANISNGGNPNVLGEDLGRFKSAVQNYSYLSVLDLDCYPYNFNPYVDGVFLSWGTNGEGISSMGVDFIFNSTGFSSRYYSGYTVNMTSLFRITGHYTQLTVSQKEVSLSCNVFNEGKLAGIENLAVYYEQDNQTEWVLVASPIITNYGNGTYTAIFTAENVSQLGLPVSVHCQDTRGISIWANVTLSG